LLIFDKQEQDQCAEAEENVQRLMGKKAELESNIQELSERLDEEVENNANVAATRRKLEAEIDHLEDSLEDVHNQMSAVEQEKQLKERDCQALEGELEKANDSLGRASKEKKALEERLEVRGVVGRLEFNNEDNRCWLPLTHYLTPLNSDNFIYQQVYFKETLNVLLFRYIHTYIG